MTKVVIVGWVIELLGLAVWFYGYLTTGHASLLDWHSIAPWWIADCLPNLELEIGMGLMFAGMVPIYWPRRQEAPR